MKSTTSTWKNNPSILAGYLLVFRSLPFTRLFPDMQGPQALTEAAILKATGSSRSQAYASQSRLLQLLDTDFFRSRGRPVAPQGESFHAISTQLSMAALAFVMDHPGCVASRGSRRYYSPAYKTFVLELVASVEAKGTGFTIGQCAEALCVPYDTLQEWRTQAAVLEGVAPLVTAANDPEETTTPSTSCSVPTSLSHTQEKSDTPSDANSSPRLETASPSRSTSPPTNPTFTELTTKQADVATLLYEYAQWTGSFKSFCHHVYQDLRIPFKKTMIASILEAAGVRTPRFRRGNPQAPWSHNTFVKLFPGAQWVGDGKTLTLTLNGQSQTFNLEAIADAGSSAVIAAHISEQESAEALIQAFAHGVATTGEPPLFLTVDNRSSNLCPSVQQALAPTPIIPVTPGRGEAKAPIEGAFGLFEQGTPPLVVEGQDNRELAKSILTLVVWVWFWARNGRPKKRLGGLSCKEYYRSNQPTPEEIQEAKQYIDVLVKRQERIRQTQSRRADAARVTLLREELLSLGITLNHDHPLPIQLARYSLNAICEGLATFKAKRDKGSLPEDADHGRYLGGIIRNIDKRNEHEKIATYLLDLRVRHHQLTLAPFIRQAETLCANISKEHQPLRLVEPLKAASSHMEMRFWGQKIAEALSMLASNEAHRLYPVLVGKVARCFSMPHEMRSVIISWLASAVVASQPNVTYLAAKRGYASAR